MHIAMIVSYSGGRLCFGSESWLLLWLSSLLCAVNVLVAEFLLTDVAGVTYYQ
jgi:hypothetical protein